LKSIKEKIKEIWEAVTAGEYTRNLLQVAFGLQAISQNIVRTLALPKIDLNAVDAASNALVPLTADYRRIMKLLGQIIVAIGLAAAVLAYFQVAAPWLPLITGIGYVTVIGGTVLVGMEYCGAHRVLQWVQGVHQIADAIGRVR
jgi:hypothetical protein